MTRYTFSYNNPNRQFFNVEVQFDEISGNDLIVHLPNWRPGRYEIQQFAKRIKHFEAKNQNGEALAIEKIDLASWQIETQDSESVIVSYEYYAALMDAGNSWLDDEQLYINFINCAIYSDSSRNQPCLIQLDLPDSYEIACGLAQNNSRELIAPNYNILVDSPLFASADLRLVKYTCEEKEYHLWFQGQMNRSDEELIHDFKCFTHKTFDIMGSLPCSAYHFLFQILPYKHYHGVEHWNSTVITIGPQDALGDRERYIDFLGVSCHELFHTWNVIRLRPEEMVPYGLQSPNLHYTGFITEGVTTYYGDLILARSAVYSFEEYVAEINKLLTRHFSNEGRKHYSVAESSFDLWLDGYENGIPGRKVSIYNEGALAAMILDLSIRQKFSNVKSLDDVMRLMWQRHGKEMTGYSWQDYQQAAEEVFEAPLDDYFDHIIFGTSDYSDWLFPLLEKFGIMVQELQNDNSIIRAFGFKMTEQVINDIASNSPAEEHLMLQDKVIEMTNANNGLNLKVERYGKTRQLKLDKSEAQYYAMPQVTLESTDLENELLKGWLEI